MRRPSHVIEELVSNIDALSGKCYTKHQSDEFTDEVCRFRPGYMVADVLLVNGEGLFTELARTLEYCIAKPLYHLENKISGKQPSPGWTFSR
jgi:hypothetical protein|tara:strand:+ start:250 stop:525 length:276 start_codon:yes stop_codon:yes gene_type:complete